ncbi:MAG: endonuclease III [Minisyncoccota bacterium]
MAKTTQSKTKEQERTKKIIAILKKLFPKAGMMLKYSNNWELLVSVVLSAQCTDKKVNEVTEKLFKKYRTLDDYVNANPREFERDIFSTGFYKNKAKNILAAAKMLKEKFGGNVPKTMEEILMLPGVARKTANVVLGNAYRVVEGIAVDTHVRRIANILGLTKSNNPTLIERDLMVLIPRKDWFKITYLFIEYGRIYCPAKKHDHPHCPLAAFHVKI